jgi:cytochrome c551/c552
VKSLAIALLAGAAFAQAPDQALITKYCAGCHSGKTPSGGFSFENLNAAAAGDAPQVWEKVVRKVRAGMMPPSGVPRPERKELDAFAGRIEAALDRAGAQHPDPGRPGLHRLNRTEYANVIRDLLDLDVDVSTLLPADDSSEGFDNVAEALAISPALVERYTAAALKISKLAVGNMLASASTVTYRAAADFSQSGHIEGLPLGTIGGMLVKHNFPLDAEYAIKIRARGGTGGVGVVGTPEQDVEVSIDGARVRVSRANTIDLKLPIKAGPRTIGVALVRHSPGGADEIWNTVIPGSSVQSIAITGPLNPSGPGDTPSRRRIFTCRPAAAAEEAACAKKIVTNLATRAFRQDLSNTDLDSVLTFYQKGRSAGSFDDGIEQALSRILVDPRFVFRFERVPAGAAAGKPYRISDFELASRLSFFLWSSIPDDELLESARRGRLHDPAELEKQVRRMLADPRSKSLVTSFGDQWLYLRELKSARPETRDFNDNLRQAFRTETEMLLESIMREDRSVVDLLNADYTFVNETLARHYGIPEVRGSRFRKVTLTDNSRRGLLGQGSFLLVTSVATRTSPVARGKWILENILGVPAPLPPPAVPSLPESDGGGQPVSVRAKMELHRQNPVCASCHKIMDPIGFALEGFDLVGRARTTDGGAKIDTTGQLVDGTRLDGAASLREALLSRSDVFVRTMTQKLMIYAVGRPLQYTDMPAVRAITAEASRDRYRFSALITGIVKSPQFQMRMKPTQEERP